MAMITDRPTQTNNQRVETQDAASNDNKADADADASYAARQIGRLPWLRLRLTPTLISLPLGLLIWKLVSLPYTSAILPAPEVVAARWWEAFSKGVFWKHGSVTVTEALLGFALAFVAM